MFGSAVCESEIWGMLNISISDKSFVYGFSFAQHLQRKVGFEEELERSANIVRGAEKGPITSHHATGKLTLIICLEPL